jgi:hypothetical protein
MGFLIHLVGMIIRFVWRLIWRIATRVILPALVPIFVFITKAFWLLIRLLALSITSLFIGVSTTIHRLAAGETERKTGYPYEQKMELYNWNRIKATFLLACGWIAWIAFCISIYSVLTRVLN